MIMIWVIMTFDSHNIRTFIQELYVLNHFYITVENDRFLFVDTYWLKKSACQRVDVDKKYLIMVELLDNKIVQPIKVCIFHTFLGLNYFIIQEFNPNKKYFLYMSWVELLDNKIVQSILLNYFIIQKFKSSKLNL